HDRLGVEPASLIEQAAQLAAAVPILLDGVLIVDAGDKALVGDEEQRHARSLVNAAALRFDNPIFNLIGHAEAVSSADAVGLKQQGDGIFELPAIESYGQALFEADGHLFAAD